jgi:hypothetical protein
MGNTIQIVFIVGYSGFLVAAKVMLFLQ